MLKWYKLLTFKDLKPEEGGSMFLQDINVYHSGTTLYPEDCSECGLPLEL
jgi:hypothetical protein